MYVKLTPVLHRMDKKGLTNQVTSNSSRDLKEESQQTISEEITFQTEATRNANSMWGKVLGKAGG